MSTEMNIKHISVSVVCSLLFMALIAVVSARGPPNNPSNGLGRYAVKASAPSSCDRMDPDRRFECGDGTCIWGRGVRYPRVCDGFIDCYTGNDERDCYSEHGRYCREDRRAGKKLFRCADGMCIDARWQNDGEMDCLDESDED